MIQDPGSSLPHSSGSSTWGNSQSQCLMMKGRKKPNLVSIGDLEQKITRVPLAHHSRLLHSDFSRQFRKDTHLHLIFNRFCFQLRLLYPLRYPQYCEQKIKDWWDTEKQYGITEKADRTAQRIKAWISSCCLSGKVDDKQLGEKKT